MIPERLKEKLADGLVELLAGSAERLGSDQIAGNLRRLSARGELLQSVDHALEASVARFIQEYMAQDEDLVEAIRADALFWKSDVVQDALIELVELKMIALPTPVPMLATPRPYHNLPHPTHTHFVGREEELAWLRQRLSPIDRAWQIAITGIGGVGKSALTLAVAHEYQQRYNELVPEERFEAIVWVSAKEEVLTAFGRERANVPEQILHTLEDVYTAIARVLEREDITRAQPEEQNALVEKALKRQRTLLIMDNLESVKDDRIKAFLRNLPPPTKAIITSRESLDVADVRPLTGLRWEAAEGLIVEQCRGREVTLTASQRKRIFDLTYGLPLPIKLGIARMAGGESFALVERWLGDAVGELPEYCVKRNGFSKNMVIRSG